MFGIRNSLTNRPQRQHTSSSDRLSTQALSIAANERLRSQANYRFLPRRISGSPLFRPADISALHSYRRITIASRMSCFPVTLGSITNYMAVLAAAKYTNATIKVYTNSILKMAEARRFSALTASQKKGVSEALYHLIRSRGWEGAPLQAPRIPVRTFLSIRVPAIQARLSLGWFFGLRRCEMEALNFEAFSFGYLGSTKVISLHLRQVATKYSYRCPENISVKCICSIWPSFLTQLCPCKTVHLLRPYSGSIAEDLYLLTGFRRSHGIRVDAAMSALTTGISNLRILRHFRWAKSDMVKIYTRGAHFQESRVLLPSWIV